MDKKKDILSSSLRDRKEDFKMPVDDAVWEKIIAGLPPQVPQKKPVVKKLWVISSVAAVLLIALLVGRWLIAPEETQVPSQQTATLTTPSSEKNSTNEVSIAEAITTKPDKTSTSSAIKPTKTVAGGEKKEVTITHSKTTAPSTVSTDTDQEVEKQQEREKQVSSPPDPEERKRQQESFDKAGQQLPDLWIESSSKEKKKSGKVLLALAMGNQSSSFVPSPNSTGLQKTSDAMPLKSTVSGETSSSNVLNLSDVFPFQNKLYAGESLFDNSPSSVERDFKMPITVSFLIRKQFENSRWAIESGLTYTYLKSTENIVSTHTQSAQLSRDIELNYLGIPLKAVYSIYQSDRLSVYATAGGLVEKSIKGKETVYDSRQEGSKSQNLKISEPQWSLLGNLGINYRLVRQFGLFVEPGVQYFFDDGSPVETIRKDKPFTFGVQAGIRLIY